LVTDESSTQSHAPPESESFKTDKTGKSSLRWVKGGIPSEKFCRKGRQALKAHE
jgi:hypothetical protein